MSFNAKKCSLLKVTRKRNITQSTYAIEGTPLVEVTQHTYLGEDLTSDLTRGTHINKISSCALKILHMLVRVTKEETRDAAYKGAVRPHMEYASSVWAPTS